MAPSRPRPQDRRPAAPSRPAGPPGRRAFHVERCGARWSDGRSTRLQRRPAGTLADPGGACALRLERSAFPRGRHNPPASMDRQAFQRAGFAPVGTAALFQRADIAPGGSAALFHPADIAPVGTPGDPTAVPRLTAWARRPPERRTGHECGQRQPGREGDQRRAIGATTAVVSRTRSAGSSSISSPRRPAETWIVGQPIAEVSSAVGMARRVPSGEIPPRT